MGFLRRVAPSVPIPLNAMCTRTAFQSIVRLRSFCLKVSQQLDRLRLTSSARYSPVPIIQMLNSFSLYYNIPSRVGNACMPNNLHIAIGGLKRYSCFSFLNSLSSFSDMRSIILTICSILSAAASIFSVLPCIWFTICSCFSPAMFCPRSTIESSTS